MGKFVLLLILTIHGSMLSAAEDALQIDVTYLTREQDLPTPLSLLDLPIDNNGRRGALLGLKDNQTTGSFLNQIYNLKDIVIASDGDLLAAYRAELTAGKRLFIVDLGADDLLAVADVAQDVLLFSVRAKDDRLRNQDCRSNTLHFPPSRAMLADGLAQYLAWKRWKRAVLIEGRHEIDKAYAKALRRAVKRFGLKLIEEKAWTAEPGARRTDSGHHSLQQEIPTFTRFKKHDVVLVADEQDEFGEYLLFRSTQPRLVAGTQGLMPTSWHRTQEQWGATQIQRRFEKLANRSMSETDYAAWAAMRALGEAATHTNSNVPGELQGYMLSDQFKLAGFKGVPLTFRKWNGQLRQPILVVGPRMLVSVSPQKGYLHQRSELDTLGYDEPESTCRQF